MDKARGKLLDQLAESVKFGELTKLEDTSRRRWIANFGLITASSVVLWNCGKKSDNAASAGTTSDPKADAGLYSAALKLENEAIGIYMAAAGLDNVKAATTVFAIAGAFLAHHQDHAAQLTAAIKALKAANPSAGVADPDPIVTAAATLDAATAALLTDKTNGVVNVVRLAAQKELGAAKAYISLIPKFTDIANATLHGLIGADEAGHYGVLRAALATVLGDTRDTSLTGATVVSASTIDKATATAPA